MKSNRQFAEYILSGAVGLLLFSFWVPTPARAFSLQMSAATRKTAVVAGATGYIGKSVVRESVRQGYKTVALVRDKNKVNSKDGDMLYGQFFEGADVVECDVTKPEQLTKVGQTPHKLMHCYIYFIAVSEPQNSVSINI
jgi:nucleoside-diphosphate-sugar epimerase